MRHLNNFRSLCIKYYICCRYPFSPEVVHAKLSSGVVAGFSVVPSAVVLLPLTAEAAVEAGAGPDPLADEAVGHNIYIICINIYK